jgi:hypothetical protein
MTQMIVDVIWSCLMIVLLKHHMWPGTLGAKLGGVDLRSGFDANDKTSGEPVHIIIDTQLVNY